MRRIKTVLFTLIAAVSVCALAVGAGVGFEAVDTSVVLTSPKDWLHAFTAHSDSILLAEGAAAVATKDIKEQLDKLGKNIDRIFSPGGLEDQIKEANDSASELKTKVEKRSLDNAEYVDKIKELVTDETIEKTREELKEILTERLDEFEVKVLDGTKGTGRGPQLGEKAVKSVQEADITGNSGAGRHTKATLEGFTVKDVTNADASAGDAVFPDQREEIIQTPLRQPRILDLLTVISTDSDAVEYLMQETETDNAGVQENQGDSLSKSDWTMTLETANVRTIGHIAKTSIQILDDAPRIRGFVNTRLRMLLNLELDDQLLLGDGMSGNLPGLVPNATAYDSNLQSSVVDTSGDNTVTDLDRIRVMMLQTQRATFNGRRVNLQPTGIVLPPLNWAAIELEKTAEGAYKFVNPQNSTAPRLWGLPVVATNGMEEGEALVGNFAMAATFYDRMQAAIEVSTENSDDFERLLATFRAYLRAALAIEFSEALIHNDSMDASAPSAGS